MGVSEIPYVMTHGRQMLEPPRLLEVLETDRALKLVSRDTHSVPEPMPTWRVFGFTYVHVDFLAGPITGRSTSWSSFLPDIFLGCM